MWAPSTVLQQVAAAVAGRCICLSRSMFTIQGSFQTWSLLIVFVTVNCNNQRVHWPWEFEGQSVHMLCLRQVLKSPVLLQCFSGYDMSAFACIFLLSSVSVFSFSSLFSLLYSFFFSLSSLLFLLFFFLCSLLFIISSFFFDRCSLFFLLSSFFFLLSSFFFLF